MPILIVVNNPNDWPIQIPEIEVVSARSYLVDEKYTQSRNVKVFNLCRSYRYQSIGYYVSLLAEARGHKPVPNIVTIQDMKSPTLIRFASEELEEIIQKSLSHLKSEQFVLSIYFGRNTAAHYERLSSHLFKLFQAPFVRAHFSRSGDKWQLQNVGPISANEIPEAHHDSVIQFAREYFSGKRISIAKKSPARYDLAILFNSDNNEKPSNEKAIRKFVKAAESIGLETEIINKDDYSRIAEFDALFIRETTNVHHYTYRFSRRAMAEGLVVVDDPNSILKCSNKVYLAELLQRHKIPAPQTMVVHRDNIDQVLNHLKLPIILKEPDSAFSQGVSKAETKPIFIEKVKQLLEKSDLIIAQEFCPTEFDWRIGVFDGKPLFACKYFMAKRHWQVVKRDSDGNKDEGKSETLPVELVPYKVIRTALKAANLIGNGLYGVDLKQNGQNCTVIEVNDNPNIDAGIEDTVLKDELYRRIMEGFLRRIEQRKMGLKE